jgi:hypothetical protein
MLTSTQQAIAERLAQMNADEWEHAIRRGYLNVNIDPARSRSESGIWTPVNLDAETITAARESCSQNRMTEQGRG